MELYGNAGRLVTPAPTLLDIEFDEDKKALARFEEAREWRSRAAYAAGRGAMEAMGLVVDTASPKEDMEEACVYITTNARRTDAVYKTAVAYIKKEGNKGGK